MPHCGHLTVLPRFSATIGSACLQRQQLITVSACDRFHRESGRLEHSGCSGWPGCPGWLADTSRRGGASKWPSGKAERVTLSRPALRSRPFIGQRADSAEDVERVRAVDDYDRRSWTAGYLPPIDQQEHAQCHTEHVHCSRDSLVTVDIVLVGSHQPGSKADELALTDRDRLRGELAKPPRVAHGELAPGHRNDGLADLVPGDCLQAVCPVPACSEFDQRGSLSFGICNQSRRGFRGGWRPAGKI